LEEEVAINTSDADEFFIADGEDSLERLDCGGGFLDAFAFGDEAGFVITRPISNQNGDGEHVRTKSYETSFVAQFWSGHSLRTFVVSNCR
jgi:hypothetical protein